MEILEVTGRVQKITPATSKSGKKFWKVGVEGNDNVLYAWDWKAIADIKIGLGARFEVEEQNNFLNIIKAETTTPGEVVDEPMPTATQPPSTSWKSRRRDAVDSKDNPFITRMSCLKTAVDYFNLQIGDGVASPTLEEVISVALRFEEFVESGS